MSGYYADLVVPHGDLEKAHPEEIVKARVSAELQSDATFPGGQR